MKSGVFGSYVLVMALVSSIATAQTPSAATVLANVQKFYASTTQLSAGFRQTVNNATFNTSKTSEGHVWLAKPSSFRWDYVATRAGSSVVNKSFVCDGTTIWAIDYAGKQIMQRKAASSLMPNALTFFTGGTALSSQFTSTLNTSGTYGTKGTFVLELTPNQPSASYKKLLFVVDPTDWHVDETIVIDTGNNENHILFIDPDTTTAVNASLFQVNLAAFVGYRFMKL